MSTILSSEEPTRFRHVVVRAPNWLGDAVLSLPAMAALRAHFGSAQLTVAAPLAVAGLLREATDVRPDRILELPDDSGAAIAALRSGGFDAAVLMPNSVRSAWQAWRAHIPHRWGYATAGRGFLLTRRSSRPLGFRHRHHIDYFRGLVRGLGVSCDDSAPRLAPSPLSRERARALLLEKSVGGAPLVGIAPGAAYGQAKQWPSDRTGALIARLVKEHGAVCVIVGASHDRGAAREIESWLRANAPDALPRTIDLVGRTTVGTLTGVVAHCRVFVSNDSGAMHVAAALGRPVVAIFGPTDERSTGPIGAHDVITQHVFCRPCLLRDCPIDHRCMKRISVDRVYEATAARLLASAPTELAG